MKDKILTGLALMFFALSLVVAVSSCQKDENDPLPYLSTQQDVR